MSNSLPSSRTQRPPLRQFHPRTLALVASYDLPRANRYFWSDWTTRVEMLKVQGARTKEEILSPQEGAEALAHLETLVPDLEIRTDVLAVLQWLFNLSLANLDYQVSIRNAKYSAVYLEQHNDREVMFQHFVGTFPLLGQLLFNVKLYQWASRDYKDPFPDPRPFLPIIKAHHNAPAIYLKVGTTSTAYGPCAVRNPFETRAKLGIDAKSYLLDPSSAAAEQLIFSRTDDGEEPLEAGFDLRYGGQSVAEDGAGGRSTGPGHGVPSIKKNADGTIRHGSSSIAWLGRPDDLKFRTADCDLDDDALEPPSLSPASSVSSSPIAPSSPQRQQQMSAAARVVGPSSPTLLSPSANSTFYAYAAVDRAHSDGFFSLVEQASIEGTASCCSKVRLAEAQDDGMDFVSAGAGGGVGTNIISAYDNGMCPTAPLEKYKVFWRQGLAFENRDSPDWTDPTTVQRYRFPNIWPGPQGAGVTSFSINTSLLSSLGMSRRNRPILRPKRDDQGWTAEVVYYKAEEVKDADAKPTVWHPPYWSPVVAENHLRYYVSSAITKCAEYERAHGSAAKKEGVALEQLGITEEDVAAAQKIVDEGPVESGSAGKRHEADEQALKQDSLRLQFQPSSNGTNRLALGRPPLVVKGMTYAPTLSLGLKLSIFGSGATLDSVPTTHKKPIAVRLAEDDWSISFVDKPDVSIPIVLKNLTSTPRKVALVIKTLELHWAGVLEEQGH